MTRTLHLTSPLMTGPDVLAAQRLLHAGNAFHQDYQPGPVDGQFGEASARAAARAHYWVGDRVAQPVYGDRLHRILMGTTTLTPAQAVRRAVRLKKLEQTPTREKALAWLTGHIGDKEHPAGSNRIPWASEWYGIIGPWCAMAVTRAYVEAGSKTFVRGRFYAYVPFIVADARAGRNGLSVTTDPKPGDLVCYDWQGDGTADHVGLFEKWILNGTTFLAVEGNTSSDNHGDQSNGGEVCRKTRPVSLVQAFVHVSR